MTTCPLAIAGTLRPRSADHAVPERPARYHSCRHILRGVCGGCSSSWRARTGADLEPAAPRPRGRRCGSLETAADQPDEADLAFSEAAVDHRDAAVLRHGQLAHEQALEAPIEPEVGIGGAGHDRVPHEAATAIV